MCTSWITRTGSRCTNFFPCSIFRVSLFKNLYFVVCESQTEVSIKQKCNFFAISRIEYVGKQVISSCSVSTIKHALCEQQVDQAAPQRNEWKEGEKKLLFCSGLHSLLFSSLQVGRPFQMNEAASLYVQLCTTHSPSFQGVGEEEIQNSDLIFPPLLLRRVEH